MGRKFQLIALRLTLFTSAALLLASPSALADSRQSVTDVSWPNCKVLQLGHGLPVVIGVNGGLDFHPNPCLRTEAQLSGNNYALYLNTGYPGPQAKRRFAEYPKACDATNTLCLAYNYGYNAARYAITYANLQLAHSNVWWLDVETSNSWTANVLQNRAALQGMVDVLRQHTFMPTIGFYSYPGQWALLTGNWRPALPAWIATGSTSYQVAAKACQQPSFTAARVWLAQYTTKLDHNLVCSPAYGRSFRL